MFTLCPTFADLMGLGSVVPTVCQQVKAFFAAVLLFSLFTPAAQAQTFFEDFNGGTLNSSVWNVGNWTLGRTQLGNTPTVAGGIATLRLDTYNPGNTSMLRGSEIFTTQAFTPGPNGIDVEARVRTNMTAAGALTTFFMINQAGQGTVSNPIDEIDFEFLTKQISQNKVLATTWNNWTGNFAQQYNDGIHHRNNDPAASAGQTPPGVNLTQWNTFRIRWLPNSTEWYINDVLFYQTAEAHPNEAMQIRFNFWAPDSSWGAAFDSSLSPVNIASANTSYFYDVDYVRVTPVPEPACMLVLGAATCFGVWRVRRRGIMVANG
jgi:hypothetical protein